MTHRLANAFIAATSLAIALPAVADIGFAQAIDIARATVPNTTLFEITQRTQSGDLIYQPALFAAPTTQWEMRINSATGSVAHLEDGPMSASDLAKLEVIMSLLPAATVDFAQAIDLSVAAAPAGALPNKASYDIEFNMLAIKVLLNDSDISIYIDTVTGNQIPHHEAGEDHEDSVAGTSFIAALDAAIASTGLPVLRAEAEDQAGAASVNTLFWDAAGGQLVLVTVNATTMTVTGSQAWTPTAAQLAQFADDIAVLPLMTVGASAAAQSALAQNVGAILHAVELEPEHGSATWKVELITATGFELDVFVDAGVPSSSGCYYGCYYVRAAVNFAPSDLNQDGVVNGADIGLLLGLWGSFDPINDLNGDGVINGGDLGVMLGSWQP